MYAMHIFLAKRRRRVSQARFHFLSVPGFVGFLWLSLFSYQYALAAPSFDEKKNSVLTSVGLTLSDGRDKVLSQLFRFGVAGQLRLGYSYLDSDSYHFLTMEFAGGSMFQNYQNKNEYPDDDRNQYQFFVHLNYASQFRVLERKWLRLYTGWVLESTLDFWIPYFLSYAWSGHFALGPALTGVWQNGKHRITSSLLLPMIGSLSRPAFNSYNLRMEFLLEQYGIFKGGVQIITENSRFAFWHNFFRVLVLFDYSYNLTPYLDLLASYTFKAAYYEPPQIKQAKLNMRNSFHIGLAWKW